MKIDLEKILLSDWDIISRAYDETLNSSIIGQFSVEKLKQLSEIGVLDLAWINTSHEFATLIKQIIGEKRLSSLGGREKQELILNLVEQSYKWFTPSIKCNWTK